MRRESFNRYLPMAHAAPAPPIASHVVVTALPPPPLHPQPHPDEAKPAVRRPYRRLAPVALWLAGRQLMFHVLNSALGFVGFVVIGVALSVSLALLPLCGVGVRVFHTVIPSASTRLSRVDVLLHNLIVDRTTDHIEYPSRDEQSLLLPTSHHNEKPALEHGHTRPPTRLASPPSPGLAIAYFGVVKPVLALLSVLCLVLLALFAVALTGDNLHVHITDRSGEKMDVSVWIYAECLGSALLCTAALHGLARVSQSTTRTVCCQ